MLFIYPSPVGFYHRMSRLFGSISAFRGSAYPGHVHTGQPVKNVPSPFTRLKISTLIGTRTPTQVRLHARNHFLPAAATVRDAHAAHTARTAAHGAHSGAFPTGERI